MLRRERGGERTPAWLSRESMFCVKHRCSSPAPPLPLSARHRAAQAQSARTFVVQHAHEVVRRRRLVLQPPASKVSTAHGGPPRGGSYLSREQLLGQHVERPRVLFEELDAEHVGWVRQIILLQVVIPGSGIASVLDIALQCAGR